jgi:hypothetical protein
MHQLRERRDIGRVAAKSIGDELSEIIPAERRQAELLHPRSGASHRACVSTDVRINLFS